MGSPDVLARFVAQVNRRRDEAGEPVLAPDDYAAIHHWSVTDLERFWGEVWTFFDVVAHQGHRRVLGDTDMPGARWFEGATLNYAENVLRPGADPDPALVSITEDGNVIAVSRGELRRDVGALAAFLRAEGVEPGDRVVGYVPAGRHAVIGLLATVAVGGVWSACGPDLGADGALARFAQLRPRVAFVADGYRFKGRPYDRRAESRALLGGLPGVRTAVTVPHLDPACTLEGTVSWDRAVAEPAPPRFEPMPFDSPLWVLFTSGTTGRPKGLVHGHGGVTVEHFKVHGLHHEMGPGDVLFTYTTTNWMLWNSTVSGMLLGATAVFYDGHPSYPDAARLWDIAAEHGVTVFGTSPGHLVAGAKAGVRPARNRDLSRLRTILCTGAPLAPTTYDWVRAELPETELVAETGGTDVVTAFATSAAPAPPRRGAMSAPALGVDLQAWDDRGRPMLGAVGELVVARPMPSMPLAVWDDPDGSRYHETYFSTFPGVWRHGDWVVIDEDGGVVVTGRSDATLNRHGVRIGSADIYDVVEAMPEVTEALVVGVERAGRDYWMPLFLVLSDGVTLDEGLQARIRERIRTQVSPRHVPDEVIAVAAIPHTPTGKKLEVPVKRILTGAPVAEVAGAGAVDDPAALEFFRRFVRTSATSPS